MGITRGELDHAIRRALNIFDEWNDVTGIFTRDCSAYGEITSIIEDAVHCGAQEATKDFRKLESEER